MTHRATPVPPAATAPTSRGTGRLRYSVLAMLFLVTALNYGDRATLSLAGPALAKDLGLDAVTMGYLFSAFGWSYVLAQLPGGWLLDRFGSRRVYGLSILAWSLFTLLQGTLPLWAATAGSAVAMLFALRLLVGVAEAPAFPANARIVATWFPTVERGTASAIFNSAQYFATVMFSPLMGWLAHTYGWTSVFYCMGALGVMVAALWFALVYSPGTHPRISARELAHIGQGGALVHLDLPGAGSAAAGGAPAVRPGWSHIRQLLGNRMLLGVYVGQYCITTLTYFFLTWFPVYLVKQRHMTILNAGFVAAIPAICGFLGGVLGGLISDLLLRRGYSLTAARKTPIVLGMLLSMSMIACNYLDSSVLVVAVMALAFFGKGVGALGWAVVADTSPREISGLSGALFNTFGNSAGITTPIVIGYIVGGTGSFDGALIFVAANALLAVLCYLLVVGEIRRVVLRVD